MTPKTQSMLNDMANTIFVLTGLREAVRTGKITLEEAAPQLRSIAKQLTTLALLPETN